MSRGGFFRFAEPLSYPAYRRLWIASFIAYLGQFIQGVGAAWAMTQSVRSEEMVALVQTAALIPIMLLSIPAGALADMYDRQKVMLVALGLAFIAAVALTVLAIAGLLSPLVLLVFTFLVATGGALFAPAWQASLRDQLPIEILPAGIALRTVAYNAGRSIGPAIGGIVVAAAGFVSAFAAAACCFIPMLVLAFGAGSERAETRFPPERLDHAVLTGLRYIRHTPAVRRILLRVLFYGLSAGGVAALTPLIGRDMLHGSADTYGLLLSAFGMGAVVGAVLVSEIRRRATPERAVTAATAVMAAGTIALSFSSWLALSLALLLAMGTAWMLVIALCNIGVQMRTPPWVTGRVVAAVQASVAGGAAGGSWLWGRVSDHSGVASALFWSGLVVCGFCLFAHVFLRIPGEPDGSSRMANAPADLDRALPLDQTQGPVEIEIVYRIAPDGSAAFRELLPLLQQTRLRNGAQSWSLSRDVGDTTIWTERFACRTWVDYLRHRTRATQEERDLQRRMIALQVDGAAVDIRRNLVVRAT